MITILTGLALGILAAALVSAGYLLCWLRLRHRAARIARRVAALEAMTGEMHAALLAIPADAIEYRHVVAVDFQQRQRSAFDDYYLGLRAGRAA